MTLPLVLKSGEIHIWSASLKVPIKQENDYCAILSADEKIRANHFKVAKPRQQFIVARGILRSILSYYLNIKPQALMFTYTEHKKPSLASTPPSKLMFNLTHSDNVALFAIAEKQSVGIDIERTSQHAYMSVAERFFSAEEYAYLSRAPLSQQAILFHQIWTRKEAILKATGTGLSLPLNQFSVIHPTSKVEIEKKTWCYKDLSPADLHISPDYQAAIASDYLLTHLVYRDFKPFQQG